jgi:4a-hydroxytetrahydrobiopterin dehydratase
MTDQVTARQFHEAAGTEDWRVVGEGACAYFHDEPAPAWWTLADAEGNEVDVATMMSRD